MSHQYSLYPTTSAAGTAAAATEMAAPPTPMSLSTRGRSSTSTSSVSFSNGSASGSKRESRDSRDSRDSKASVGSRKDWMKAPLPVGITIGGRGMWCFILFTSAPLPLFLFLYPARDQLTELTISIPVSPYLHFHSSPPIDSIPSIRFPANTPIPMITHPRYPPSSSPYQNWEPYTDNPPHRTRSPSRRPPRPRLRR
jgi:hypothetical protein